MINALLLSALAGVGGTGLGGVIAVIIGKTTQRFNCWLLSFAGGVMTSIVFFTLIPESIELTGVLFTLLWVSIGVFIILLLNNIIDRITSGSIPSTGLHRTMEDLHHESGIISNQQNMMRSGILMFVAMALHNIPEGLVVGTSDSHSMRLGWLMTVIITLHSIPEGMVIAAPLVSAGFGTLKTILITAVSGSTALLGGLAGFYIGTRSAQYLSLSLAFAGGAMLYVTFCEILPQAAVMTESRSSSLVTLLGIVAGLLLTKI